MPKTSRKYRRANVSMDKKIEIFERFQETGEELKCKTVFEDYPIGNWAAQIRHRIIESRTFWAKLTEEQRERLERAGVLKADEDETEDIEEDNEEYISEEDFEDVTDENAEFIEDENNEIENVENIEESEEVEKIEETEDEENNNIQEIEEQEENIVENTDEEETSINSDMAAEIETIVERMMIKYQKPNLFQRIRNFFKKLFHRDSVGVNNI